MMTKSGERQYPPPQRRLRVYAFDPGLALHMETTVMNEITVSVPFELDAKTGRSGLEPGPVGDYLEIVDCDPASGVYYAPVDLDDPALLAQDGLSPSEGNPQFHQQMVYAVAMTTIQHFEQALGRVALWANREIRDEKGKIVDTHYVQRLRVYPHALREANAYYDPGKKALLFGYFRTSGSDRDNPPGTMVFTCLSHDIIAHETTHALLDGMHPRFNEATNPDTLALHEAFADIVAIFQHFSYPGVLRDQIARTRGDLASQNLLAKLAVQFGRAIGRSGALRDALGEIDEDNRWKPHRPDARKLAGTTSAHARGAILVAAVFDAFLLIYRTRIADLLRIATRGTGVLPEGEIHPDLVGRMAEEAAKSSRHVLQMCIRALDYCPPVDVDFGDYLRAIITADHDLNPEDDHNYRVAIVEAFRRRGIFPSGVRHMSPDTLCWPGMLDALADLRMEVRETGETPEEIVFEPDFEQRVKMRKDVRYLFVPDKKETAFRIDWDLGTDRRQAHQDMQHNAKIFHRWLTRGKGREYVEAAGLTLDEGAPPSVFRDEKGRRPSVEVHSVRTAFRRGAKGSLVTELVVEFTQRRRGYFDRKKQDDVDSGKIEIPAGDDGDFRFRRGCTLLIDPKTWEVRRVIRTAGDVCDDEALERVRAFLTREAPGKSAFRAEPERNLRDDQIFARIHGGLTEE